MKSSYRAATLMETLVALVILSVVMGMAMLLFGNILTYGKSNSDLQATRWLDNYMQRPKALKEDHSLVIRKRKIDQTFVQIPIRRERVIVYNAFGDSLDFIDRFQLLDE